MKSPMEMNGIQIDITNACIHTCSNCTRFCGHHKKPFFMDYDTFVKAVESMDGYEGAIGVMGGEPTIHPLFRDFCNYLISKRQIEKYPSDLIYPTERFIETLTLMDHRNSVFRNGRRYIKGFGLWSAYGVKYAENYELIQDTFDFQVLNDHINEMHHTPLMIKRSDMGIDDEKWILLRDNCWIQREWSACITPKGAFFCEIAGALDMILDGPGGWPIEKGWWKRKPEDFGDQLMWCEYCGATLANFSRDANDEIDDMSSWWFDKLNEIGSPKVKRGLVNVIDRYHNNSTRSGEKETVASKESYYGNYFDRFSEKNDYLFIEDIVACIFDDESVSCEVVVNYLSKWNEFKSIFIVTNDGDRYNRYMQISGLSEKIKITISETKLFGHKLSVIFDTNVKDNLIFVAYFNKTLDTKLLNRLKKCVINPGTIMVGSNDELVFSRRAAVLLDLDNLTDIGIETKSDFIDLWPKEKQIKLSEESILKGDYKIEPEKKYAIYGVGNSFQRIIGSFRKNQVVCLSDSNPDFWGKEFLGYKCVSPNELIDNADKFDLIYVASVYYHDIREYLISLGYEMNNIVSSLAVFGGIVL